MTETQREPVPQNDGGERDTALAFLDFQRHCLLKKCEGLDEAQLRQRVVPTDTTLLGLIQHATVGERYWFHHYVGGGPDEDWDFGMVVPEETSALDVLAAYREAWARSDEVLAAVELDQPTALPVDGSVRTVRWVVAHKTAELARHAGHADIVRELVDGTTGR